MYSNGASSISCRWHFTHHGKVREAPVNGRFRCNDWKALLYAATAGFGITLGPENILEPEVKAGRLVRVLSDYEGPARPMHVLYPASRKPTIKLRSFIDALIAEFRVME
ncbi:hypothetical protein C9426_14605 [Serratia sp. S1B]|nr:hypothetical protein C9426_14605 [Serratia sp. S1B]